MAGQRNFEDAYQDHLKLEQRREVLETLREALERSTTLGEVIDAAETVGWGEAMGDLRLSDLANALRRKLTEDDGQTAVVLSGSDIDAGDAIDSFRIETLPANATLYFQGGEVTSTGLEITPAQIAKVATSRRAPSSSIPTTMMPSAMGTRLAGSAEMAPKLTGTCSNFICALLLTTKRA